MKIVDDRNMENELIEFKELPAWCVFEVPDCDGLYIKLDREGTFAINKNGDECCSLMTSIVNTIRLDHPMTGFKYTLPTAEIRALDAELHIKRR